jgi:hypothetical protein
VSARAEHSLLHDDALLLRVEDSVARFAEPWLPLHARPPRTAAPPPATIELAAHADISAESARSGIDESPLLRFAGVRVAERANDTLGLSGASAARGDIDLAACRARIDVRSVVARNGDAAHSRDAAGVFSMLTLSAAFLVGRLGAALVHAAGAVDPGGRAWLLVGDTHAGKTTTCVSLVAGGGWRWLADDQVVLRRGADGALDVEGWPRAAHLDEGWSEAVVTGRRASVDLRTRWGERWVARAPLGGIILPAVRAAESTSVARADGALALTALVRQSPWLMADRGVASTVLALLRDAASRPAAALSLGRDSYARGDLLAERLTPAMERAAAH